MLGSFLAKYGYIAILLGTVFEGETIMIMGGFFLLYSLVLKEFEI